MKKLLLAWVAASVPFLAVTARAQTAFVASTPAPEIVSYFPMTCGTASSQIPINARNRLQIAIPPSAASLVCFAWGKNKTARVNAPSECYASGEVIEWGGGTGACIVPAGADPVVISIGIGGQR